MRSLRSAASLGWATDSATPHWAREAARLPERLEAPQLRPNLGAALLTGRLERLGGDPVSVAGAPGSTGDSVAGPLVRHRATRVLVSGLPGASVWANPLWLARSRALAGRRTICGLACALTRVPSPISAIGRRTWICPSDRRGRYGQRSGRDEHRQELSGAGHIWNLLLGRSSPKRLELSPNWAPGENRSSNHPTSTNGASLHRTGPCRKLGGEFRASAPARSAAPLLRPEPVQPPHERDLRAEWGPSGRQR